MDSLDQTAARHFVDQARSRDPEADRSSVPRSLSKSKLMSCQQCEKRLWLELHRPDLLAVPASAETTLRTCHEAGRIARTVYDPRGAGTLIDVEELGIGGALARTAELVEERRPIFEAGFAANGALGFTDILLPVERNGSCQRRMVEVKASTSEKDHHRDDCAIQAYVARKSSLQLSELGIAHIDSNWTCQGSRGARRPREYYRI